MTDPSIDHTTYRVTYVFMEAACLLIKFPIVIKIVFCIWLTAPNFQGAYYIYSHLIKHHYDLHEEEIDKLIVELRCKSMKYVKQTFWDILYQQTLQNFQDNPYAQSMRNRFAVDFMSLIKEGIVVDLNLDENMGISYRCYLLHHMLNLEPIQKDDDNSVAHKFHVLRILSIIVDAKDLKCINIMVDCNNSDERFTKCFNCRCASEEEATTLCSGLQIICMDARSKLLQSFLRLEALFRRKLSLRCLNDWRHIVDENLRN